MTTRNIDYVNRHRWDVTHPQSELRNAISLAREMAERADDAEMKLEEIRNACLELRALIDYEN